MYKLQERILNYHTNPNDPYSSKVWIKENLLEESLNSSAAQPIFDIFTCSTEITCKEDI